MWSSSARSVEISHSAPWLIVMAASAGGAVDYTLPLNAIGPALNDLVHGRPVARVVDVAG